MMEPKSGSGPRPSRSARPARTRAGQLSTSLATTGSGTQSMSAPAPGPAARSSAATMSATVTVRAGRVTALRPPQDASAEPAAQSSPSMARAGEISATSHFKDGKLITVSFSMKATTSEWAEADFGRGPINDFDLDAIQKCVQLSKNHENKHKEAIAQTFKEWKPKAEKDLRDGTYTNKADADNAIHAKIDELKGKLQAACLDLHSKEGLIEVTFIKGHPKANVVMKPAGNTGCDP